MRLEFIPLDKLCVSKANMRFAKKQPDVADLLPTVRAKGVLQTLLVRPNGFPTTFEIVAGVRRFRAAQIVADERATAGEAGPPEPLPCAILDDADDAEAIEASLIENLARLDPDEVRQWETFTRLVREGRTVEDIGLTFGLPDLTVKRVLALGNLLPRIRALYAAEEIDRATVRHLTLASKRQQQDWLTLYDDPQSYAPQGSNLKAWLLGGQSVPVAYALFEIEGSGLIIIVDLFGEGACFADAAAFWAAQNAAVEALRTAYVEAGWSDAVVVPPSDYFQTWEYEKCAKRKGGRVYLDVRQSGEVVVHEGYVLRREAQRSLRGSDGTDAPAKPARAEVTSALQTYIDLHRHAAVRVDLTHAPGVALRLLVAHAIIGSPLIRVTPEPQTARHDDIRQSVFASPGEALFDERRRAVLALLGASPDDPNVTGGNGDEIELGALFLRLLDLPDPALMDVIAIVMGEGLASGSAAVDLVATRLGTDMADWWKADPAFFDLVRDKQVLTGMMTEVAGAAIAGANAKETGKTMKKIIADHLAGAEGRPRVERWVPKWLAFPPAAYTERGGVGSVRAHARAVASQHCAEEQREAEAARDDDRSEPAEIALVPEGEAMTDAGGPDEGDERLAA
jgi:ParB family chromosome partitioning protein